MPHQEEPLTPLPSESNVIETVDVCLQLGKMLLRFGAAGERVMDSMKACANQASLQPMVTYDAVGVTVSTPDGFRTRIDGSVGVLGVDVSKLAATSHLVQSLIETPRPASEVRAELNKIAAQPPLWSLPVKTLAVGVAGAMYGPLNGADPAAWGIAFFAGMTIYLVRNWLFQKQFNIFLATATAAFFGTLIAALLLRTGISETPGVALVAASLFLIPGVPIINAGVDILRNHNTTGLGRLAFSTGILVALAVGVGIFIPILGAAGFCGTAYLLPGNWEIGMTSLAGLLLAGALAIVNNGNRLVILVCALGGFTARFVRAEAVDFGADFITASLIATLTSSFLIIYLCQRFRIPVVILAVISVLPMIPGFFIIRAVAGLFEFSTGNPQLESTQFAGILGAQYLLQAVAICLTLIIGVVSPITILQAHKRIV